MRPRPLRWCRNVVMRATDHAMCASQMATIVVLWYSDTGRMGMIRTATGRRVGDGLAARKAPAYHASLNPMPSSHAGPVPLPRGNSR